MLTPEERAEIEAEFPHYPTREAVCDRRAEDRAEASRMGFRRCPARCRRTARDVGRGPGRRGDLLQPDLPQAGGPPRHLRVRQRELLDHGLRARTSGTLPSGSESSPAKPPPTAVSRCCPSSAWAPATMPRRDDRRRSAPGCRSRQARPHSGELSLNGCGKATHREACAPAAKPSDLRALRAGRRIPGAAQGAERHDARTGCRGSEGLQSARPGRRGLPHRGEVEPGAAGRARIRATWSAMPTRWSPARSRTALLMERDPHQLIEGIDLAGYAIAGDVAYIFLRGEYTLAAQRLRQAIAEAYARRISRQEHSAAPAIQPRNASAHERRPVHVRRRDRAAERARRQARQPARQAALSRRSRRCGASRP